MSRMEAERIRRPLCPSSRKSAALKERRWTPSHRKGVRKETETNETLEKERRAWSYLKAHAKQSEACEDGDTKQK